MHACCQSMVSTLWSWKRLEWFFTVFVLIIISIVIHVTFKALRESKKRIEIMDQKSISKIHCQIFYSSKIWSVPPYGWIDCPPTSISINRKLIHFRKKKKNYKNNTPHPHLAIRRNLLTSSCHCHSYFNWITYSLFYIVISCTEVATVAE
jgi:hypothetical protein